MATQLTIERVLALERDWLLHTQNRDPTTCDRMWAAFHDAEDHRLSRSFLVSRFGISYRQRLSELKKEPYQGKFDVLRTVKETWWTLVNP